MREFKHVQQPRYRLLLALFLVIILAACSSSSEEEAVALIRSRLFTTSMPEEYQRPIMLSSDYVECGDSVYLVRTGFNYFEAEYEQFARVQVQEESYFFPPFQEESYFVLPGSETFYEMKGFGIRAFPDELTPAQVANGIEWQGRVSLVCEIFRYRGRDYSFDETTGILTSNFVDEWSAWDDCKNDNPDYFYPTWPTVALRKLDGEWEVGKHYHRDSFQPESDEDHAVYQQFVSSVQNAKNNAGLSDYTCANLPPD